MLAPEVLASIRRTTWSFDRMPRRSDLNTTACTARGVQRSPQRTPGELMYLDVSDSSVGGSQRAGSGWVRQPLWIG